MKRTFLILTVALPLVGCGWFGGKSEEQAATTTQPNGRLSSDEVLKRDCADENWKKQNLGLWYSVCRQSMKW